MNQFEQQLTKPILGPNKSPLLGGKFTNPYRDKSIKSINPFYNKNNHPNNNIINKTKNFHIQLPYVRGLDPNINNNYSNMENNINYKSDINNIILEYFGPAATPTSGAAPIGGKFHMIHHPGVATLNRSSMGQKNIRQRPEPRLQTPFHNPLHTKDGLSAKWQNTIYKTK